MAVLQSSSITGTLSTTGVITISKTGTLITHSGMSDAIGYNASYGTYIGSPVGGTYYIYANGQMNNNGSIVSLVHSGNVGSHALPITGGTLNGVLYFTDTTNGIYKSGTRLTVRSESTDNVANFANYGLYLPVTGQTAGLYVESPIEARGGLRIGSGASSGTINVGADTGVVGSRLVQRDANGYIYANHINFSTPESENPPISSFITSNGDGWSRKSSLAHVRNQLGNYGNWITASALSSYLPLSGGTMSGNLKITPVSESWAEGLSFLMPNTNTWGGLRWQRQRGGSDGNWYIGFTALDGTDDLVFGANNGGSQIDNIIRLQKDGSVRFRYRTTLFNYGAGGGENLFSGLDAPTSANGRAQFVLSSAYSDLVIASSQANGSHGSTLTFATYNPSNSGDYRKFVINQGNWGARAGFLDFGFADAGGRSNPHLNINATDDVMSLDGYNKRVGVNIMSPGYTLDVGGLVNTATGYVSVGNPWGTANSAFFPNGITTAGGTNWVYGLTYLGNAPANGSGAEVRANGSSYFRNGNTSGTWGYAGQFVDRNNAANNYVPWSFENEFGNHSWGIVARFHITNSVGDRPSIQFSHNTNNTRWSVGYCYPDDNFRITQNHGFRPDNSTNDGWGTERFRINTDGNTLIFASLGIGSVTPDVRLSVNGDTHVSNILYMGGTAGSVGSWGTRTYGYGGDWTNNSRTVRFDNVGYGTSWSLTIDTSGNVQSSASMRAPIFYDSNDTGYYLDPNGDSNLWRFTMATMTRNGMNGLSVNSPWSTRSGQSSHYQNGTMGWGQNDFNTIGSYWGSGFIDTWSSPGNAPGGSSHYVGMQAMHYNDQNGNFHGWQMACAQESTNRWFWRSSWNIPNRPWVEMMHSGNIGSQSVNYANSAGTASNANTVGGIGAGSFFRDLGFEGGGSNANTIAESRSAFTYAAGAPHSGPLAYFGASGYGLQLNATYHGGDQNISYRVRNGDAGAWKSWYSFITSANIGSQSVNYANSAGSVAWGNVSSKPGNITYWDTWYGSSYLGSNGDLYMSWLGWLSNHLNQSVRTDGNPSFSSVTIANTATLNGQVNINRHIDATTTWGNCGCTTIFVGWSTSKIMLGNNASGAHNWSNDRPSNSVVSNVNHYFYNNVYAREDVVAYWSDARLKTNIKPITNALDKINKIGGYFYTPNELAIELDATKDMSERVGVMAQEIEAVLPHVVKPAPFNEKYKTVQYEKLVPLLIQGIKEQQVQIEDLKKQIEYLVENK